MTAKEAIYILRNAAWLGSDADRQKVEEAVEVVANAIEAQDMTLYMNLPEVSAEEVVEILKRNNRIELIPSGEDTNVPNTDTISRQATITEIKNYERDSTAPIDYVKIVEQMPPAQPESQWIPCSERLPENNCQCIATAKVKHVDGYPDYEVDTADYTDGIFTTANSWWGIESIIAWMPLPEGYRGEQDE